MKRILLILLISSILAGIIFFVNYYKKEDNYAHKNNHSIGEETDPSSEKGKKVLYYRSPMNPNITSPVPMKDDMGMDYVPVYEEDARSDGGVFISPERQKMIDVKTEKVVKRKLSHQILTVGKVAYDPELFVAQQEYLQALKEKEKADKNGALSIKEQSDFLLDASRRKLLLLGMNEKGIDEIARKGKPQGNIYLPDKEDTIWVYMTVYEYEIGLIKEGMPVEIEAVAFPGETFKGKVGAIASVLDPMTRSVEVRAEIDNRPHKLKPNMFVNVKINVPLGEVLAVSGESIINTGKRTIVVTANDKGDFFSKDVKLGRHAEGFYEVLDGLIEGDAVVTSGNFLVDSESRLQSAITAEHQH